MTKKLKRKEVWINLPVKFNVPENVSVRKLANIMWQLGFEIEPVAIKNGKSK